MTVKVAAGRGDAGTRLLAGASGVGFILAICGSNAMTPLLPGYMDRHGFGPAAAAVLFATYFVALIVILLISARGPLIRHTRTVLPIAFLTAIVGDLVEIVGAWYPLLLFPGRLMTGASVALSTGAAAAMMVAARGERGRAFMATGSLIGAGTGLIAAILIAVYLPWQLVTVYAVHAVAMTICLGFLFAGLRAAPDLLAPDRDPVPTVVEPELADVPSAHTGDLDVVVESSRSRDPGAYLVGALAWAIGALAVGAMPNAILATGISDSLLVAQCVGGACLIVSMLANFAGVGLRVITTLPAVGSLLALGWSIAIAGLAMGRLEVILLGTVIGGIGQAGGYRVALAYITVGLTPIQQGRVAATFSAFAYSGAGVMVVLDGVAGQLAGTIGGAVTIGVVYAVTSAIAIGLVLRRTRRTAQPAVTRPVDRETADTAS
ncbi:MFS transporter [Gordonia metallireducens]|uniref:MFS transporter n=1 Tax=Gordonia metallireducens TaxID=2897779 RepID=UPI001E644FE3|nr:MFS transporter [Gordonia metallireducens]